VVVDAPPLRLAVDAPKVERIVENLLVNAARHTPAGTTIWVRLQAQDHGVLLLVEDQGPGIPAQLREQVFQPFQQGRNIADHAPGSGIGLALVAQFASLHGGRAWVQDRPGGGASFQVFLPDPHNTDLSRA
jgi:signal transduction histidine kinase